MELILCFLIAMVVTGGRSLGDIIHAAKGTTPPRIERARLKAAARPAGSGEPGPFREYVSAVWRDAWTDAKAHHERARLEKLAGTRPTVGERAKRLGRLLVDPVGEPKPATAAPDAPRAEEPAPDPWTFSTPVADPDDEDGKVDPLGLDGRDDYQPPKVGQVHYEEGTRARYRWNGTAWVKTHNADGSENPKCPRCDLPRYRVQGDGCGNCRPSPPSPDRETAMARAEAARAAALARLDGREQTEDRPPAVAANHHPNNNGGTPMTQATGEVQNYEQHKAEIAEQRKGWQTLLDLAAASVASVAQAKSDLNAQAEQGRALAAAAQAKSDGLAGAGLDVETLSHAGTQADAVDVNKLNDQFEALEQIEADAREDQSRAEAALAALDAEEATIDAKYGDAHATVAENLGGDAAYLESGGGTAGQGQPVPAMAGRE